MTTWTNSGDPSIASLKSNMNLTTNDQYSELKVISRQISINVSALSEYIEDKWYRKW